MGHLIKKVITFIAANAIFFFLVLLGIFTITLLTGCGTEADQVSYNIAQEADNFNVYRRVVVINTLTDKPEFEAVGKMSVTIGSNRIDIIIEDDDGVYHKHFNMYVVEDLGGSKVNKYRYEVNFLPQELLPPSITMND